MTTDPNLRRPRPAPPHLLSLGVGAIIVVLFAGAGMFALACCGLEGVVWGALTLVAGLGALVVVAALMLFRRAVAEGPRSGA